VPKWHVGRIRDVGAALTMPKRPTGLQVPSSFIHVFRLVNWVSPIRPTVRWYPNRKDGGRRRG